MEEGFSSSKQGRKHQVLLPFTIILLDTCPRARLEAPTLTGGARSSGGRRPLTELQETPVSSWSGSSTR